MKCTIIHLGLCLVLGMLVSGCCVCHSLSIKNNTGSFVTVAGEDTGQGVGIPAGKRAKLAMWQGPMVIIIANNMWFYPKIDYWEHPEARRRVFHLGICQAGFGYFVTYATIDPGGRLTVGNSVYEPERKTQW